MNVFNFDIPGGYPLETDTFKQMQEAYRLFNAFGNTIGKYSIISGCIVQGQNVSNGVVYFDGELMPFTGGLIQTEVVVKQDFVRKTFENGTQPIVLTKPYMCFGTGTNAVLWSLFKRPKTNIELAENLNGKENKTVVQQLAARVLELEKNQNNIPIGLVAVWGKSIDSIPSGWREYTALSGKMPIGYNANDEAFDLIGKTGGKKEQNLDISNLPNHGHSSSNQFNLFAGMATSINKSSAGSTDNGSPEDELAIANITPTIQEQMREKKVGENKPFSILNPYRTVMFIEYVGLNI